MMLVALFVIVGIAVAVVSGYPSYFGDKDPTQGEKLGLAVGAGIATSSYTVGFVVPLTRHHDWPLVLVAFIVGVTLVILAIPTVLLVIDVVFNRRGAPRRAPAPEVPEPSPYRAVFTPQAWINDQAVDVDPEGITEWSLPEEEALNVAEYQRTTGDHDWIINSTGSPEWVIFWRGPFSADIVDAEGTSIINAMR